MIRARAYVAALILFAAFVRPAAAVEPLTIAITDSYPPLTIIDPIGEPRGLLVDMWRLWSETTGIPVKFRASNWADTLDAVRNGDADIHSGLFKNAGRAEYMYFSEPIHEVKTGLTFKAGGAPPVPLSRLGGSTVGAVEGTYQQRYVRENFPEVVVRSYADGESLIIGLLKGEVRALINEIPTVNAGLARLSLQGAFVRHKDILFSNQIVAGVARGRVDLVQIINEGFLAIPTEKLAVIEDLWLPDINDHYYTGAGGDLELTTAEREWLAENPVIRMAVTNFIDPIDIVDAQGNYRGLNADLIKLLNNKLNVNIVPEFHDTWGGVVADAMNGKVDGAFSLSQTPARETNLLFTKPYAFDPIIVVVRDGERGLAVWKDMAGKTVSVVKGSAVIAAITKVLGDGRLVEVEDEITGLRALADATVEAHVSWLLPYGNAQRADPVAGLRIALTRNTEGGTLRIAIHKSRPELYSVMRKGLNAITRAEMAEIRSRWLMPVGPGGASGIALSVGEKSWLAEHARLRVGMMNDWPPFSFVDQAGLPQGISADVADALNKRLGGVLHLVPGPWKQHLKDLEDGSLDALFDLTPTAARQEIYGFTTPYLTVPHVIVAQKEGPEFAAESDLAEKTLALERGFGSVRYFREKYPKITIREYADTSAALDAVARGEADAYAGNRAVAAYIMSREIIVNLKMHGRIDRPGSVLAMGVRKDWPILAGILEKALDDIDREERLGIVRKWVSTSESGKSAAKLELSADEKAWIKSHPKVRVMVGTWPPFHFVEGDEHKGLALDYVRHVLQSLGLEIEPMPMKWHDALKSITSDDKTVDLLPTIARSPEREKLVNISRDYLSFPRVIFAHDGDAFGSLTDLHGKSVAVERNFITFKLLQKDHPEIELMALATTKEALEAVSFGKADAYVGNMAVGSYLIEKHGLTNLKVAAQTSYKSDIQAIGVRKDWPELARLIDKALAAIPEETHREIRQRWLPGAGGEVAKAPQVELSNDQRQWLADHRNLRLGIDPSWPPFEFIDETGAYSGISSGYVEAIAERLSIEMQPVADLSWTEVMAKARSGEVDVIPAMTKSEERAKHYLFTKPYIIFPVVIAVHKGAPFVSNLSDLSGQRVGVVKDYVTHELLRNKHPAIIVVPHRNLSAGLKALNDGKIDAFVDNLGTITYVIGKENLENVKVAAPTVYNFELSMAVRKDWPELVPILDAALATLSEREKTAIKNTWMALEVTFGLDTRTILTWALPIGAAVVLVIFSFVFWNRRLGAEIGERKRAEEELAKRTNLLQAVLGSMTQGIVAFDKDLKLISWNDQYLKIRDYPEALAHAGADFAEFMKYDVSRHEFDGDDPELDVQKQVARAGKFEPHEFERQRPDGSFIEVRGGPIPGGGFVSTYTDITERKRGEDELAAAMAKLGLALDSMSDGIFLLDSETNYVMFNDRYIELLNLPAGLVREGASVRDVVRYLAKHSAYENEGQEDFIEQRIAQLGSQESANVELHIPDGPILELRQTPTEGGGMVVVCSDITERKQGEAELTLARDKAESATRAKSSFLAAMSHEIRTPMNGVVGMIDLLRETKLDMDQRQMMRTVRDSAFSLLQIINDILDFSKIEAGKLALEMLPISVRDVIEGVAETLLPNTVPKDVRLLIYIDPEIPSWLMSDQVRLRQILFNMAGNAVKFTETTPEKKGVVMIRADRAPGDDEKQIDVRFSISDNGIGMSPAAVSTLFTPFTQAESSTTRRFGGTGLGLSICKNLTDIMKGKVEVESVEGEGSTFIATLPFEVADKAPDHDDTHDLSGLHILVVAEGAWGQEIITGYLDHYGASSEVTGDIDATAGMVGAARQSDKPFDIVIIGSAWAEEIRETLIETLRQLSEGLRFVLLTDDRTAKKGMIPPDKVVVETSPLKRSSFVRAIAMAAGRASPDVDMADGPQTSAKKKVPTLEEAGAAGQLILVAEDNLTNQDVIRRQLAALGFACVMTDDGKQALQAWQTGRYAVLLTDCHMPEMDGYDLTRAIRQAEEEAQAEDARIPIVAITANALQGEGDRCLEAGMDDYMAKPLEMDKLKKTLAKWMPPSLLPDLPTEMPEEVIEANGDTFDQGERPAAASVGAIDPAALKDVFGDDDETFREILADFIEPSQAIVKDIHAAYGARNAEGIGAAGHKLKSSSRSVGAGALADLCQQLETAGKAGDWDGIERLYPELDGLMQAVEAYIEAL